MTPVQPAFAGLVRDIPDFPKKGVQFKDITPMLKDPEAFGAAVRAMAEPFRKSGVRHVIGIESRGFLLASPIALELKAGVVLVRKKGKLPYRTTSESYALEYGTDTLELQEGDVERGDRILIVDDVLATGGTAAAVCRLVERLGGTVAGLDFLIELAFLGGRAKLVGRRTVSQILVP